MADKKESFKLTKSLLHPRCWGSWVLVAIFYGLVKLPYRLQLALGRKIGRLLGHFSPKYCRTAAINLKLCFPELSDDERKRLLDRHLQSFGMGILEMGMAWWMPNKKASELAHIEGLEHLQEAIGKNRGVLILSAHFTSIEMGARILGMVHPVFPVYRNLKNPVFNALLGHYRKRDLKVLLHRHEMRKTMKALLDAKAILYAIDQDFGAQHSVFVPFFKIPTATITVPFRLAKKTDASILYLYYHRLPNGEGYKLAFTSLANFDLDQGEQENAVRFNQLLEETIRANPEQYWWGYRRFRTRPSGEVSFYQ